MTDFRLSIHGYKTYIASAIAVLSAVLGYANEAQGLFETIYLVAGALGIGFVRHGVKTSVDKIAATPDVAKEETYS